MYSCTRKGAVSRELEGNGIMLPSPSIWQLSGTRRSLNHRDKLSKERTGSQREGREEQGGEGPTVLLPTSHWIQHNLLLSPKNLF